MLAISMRRRTRLDGASRKSPAVPRRRRDLVGPVHGAALSRDAGDVAGRCDARDFTNAGLCAHRLI
jgi:hypothetical protein